MVDVCDVARTLDAGLGLGIAGSVFVGTSSAASVVIGKSGSIMTVNSSTMQVKLIDFFLSFSLSRTNTQTLKKTKTNNPKPSPCS